MVEINKLHIHDLYALQLAINNRIESIEKDAMSRLLAGGKVDNFTLKEGRNTRYIKDTAQYRSILEETFEETFSELCIEEKLIALTNAEKLIDKQLDAVDAAKVKALINDTLDTKKGAPKLVFVP